MEVYAPIQQLPGGLLGFLQLKNAGRNPTEVNSLLQMTMDLRDWYLQTNMESVVGTDAAIAAVGSAFYLTVPDGEFWCVHDCVLSINLAAAATIVCAPCYRLGPAIAPSFARPLAPLRRWDQAVEGTTIVQGAENYMPMFLPPGAGLGIRTTALSVATTAGNVVARITRLKA